MEDVKTNNHLIINSGFINGKWVNSSNGKTFSIKNPATGEVIVIPLNPARLLLDAAKDFQVVPSQTHVLSPCTNVVFTVGLFGKFIAILLRYSQSSLFIIVTSWVL